MKDEQILSNNNRINLSPCIGNCCLNQEDVCLGCFRHLNEIKNWRELSEIKQRQILIQCAKRKVINKKQRCNEV